MELLNRCLVECLRIRSPAYMTSRTTACRAQLGDLQLEPGTHVFGSQYITHLHPKVWPDPERFDPDRFLSRKPLNSREQADWFPFGGGKFVCVGQKYALEEAALGVARLFQAFKIVPLSPKDVGFDPQLTMRPAKKITIRAECAPGEPSV